MLAAWRREQPAESGEAPELRRFSRVTLGVVVLFAVVGVTPALADSPSGSGSGDAKSKSETVVIDGREYGPSDGLEIDVQQVKIKRGSGEIVVELQDTPKDGSVVPQATWGASYAISTETFQIRFDGKAKAAANVYSGKRIIQVCIWYTRGGVQKGDKVCSNATSDGFRWYAGPEKTTWCWDDLDPNAPVTQFNISTVRINPSIY